MMDGCFEYETRTYSGVISLINIMKSTRIFIACENGHPTAYTLDQSQISPYHRFRNRAMMMIMMIMIWCFTSLSTLFQSYRDDQRVIIKDCAIKRRTVMSGIPPPVGFEPGTV